jgi:hypothetical protein
MLKNRQSIMANLQSFENRLENIQQLVAKLNNGKLTAEELELLVESTRELYERSVILQYKSFEEKVFGVREEVIEVQAPVESEIEEHNEEVEEEQEEMKIVENPADQPAFDFSLFDEPTPLQPIEENEVIAVVEVPAEPEVEEHVSVSHSVVEEEEITEEKIVMEKSFVTFGGGEATALAGHFARLLDQSEKGFNMPPLDTLVGSFGLNERLQFINELFNGSSEEFAEAIKYLDAACCLDEALNKAATFGLRNQWDRESETVLDFVNKLKRRYA